MCSVSQEKMSLNLWQSLERAITLILLTHLSYYSVYAGFTLSSSPIHLTRALQDKVDAFDNICLRHIFCIPYTDHLTNATIRLRAGSPPELSQLIQTRRLWFFGHVARMDTSLDITRALKVSIRGLSKDWRRPPGSPLHTWLCTVDAELQPHNQPWPQLSIEIRSGSRTLEAPRGNRYPPARGMRVMMMVSSPIQCSCLTLENCLRLKVRNWMIFFSATRLGC